MEPKLKHPQREFFYQLPFQCVVNAVVVKHDRIIFAFYNKDVSDSALAEAQRRNLAAKEFAYAQVAVDRRDVDGFIEVVALQQRLVQNDAQALKDEAKAIAERLRNAIDS